MNSKCCICEALNHLRSQTVGAEVRQRVRALHALHRSAYMGERRAYYERHTEASENPHTIWSFIIDGMQQAHINLPHLANNQLMAHSVGQKLVGILRHGVVKEMSFYRLMEHIKGGVNANFQASLLELERLSCMIWCHHLTILLI